MSKAVIFFAPGLEECEGLLCVDILRRAGVEVTIAAVGGQKIVTSARGIHVVTHVILGLPGESRQQMLETVDYAAQSGSGGIKLQLLHVLEGTDLAEDYRAGKFTVMTLEEYVALVSACVRRLPEDMVLHRMTGDGPKRILLAPLWSGDKKRVLNALNRALAQERRDSDVLSLSAGQ